MFATFRTRNHGAALVEYGLLVGLIAVTAIASVSALGGKVDETFRSISSELSETIDGTETTSSANVKTNSPQAVSSLATFDFTAGENGSSRGYVSERFNNSTTGTLHGFSSDLFAKTDAIYISSSGGPGSYVVTYLDGTYTQASVQNYELVCSHLPDMILRPAIVSDNTYIFFRNTSSPANYFVVGTRYDCTIRDAG